jgi:hypothetical protein
MRNISLYVKDILNTIKKDLVNIKPLIKKLYDVLKEKHG